MKMKNSELNEIMGKTEFYRFVRSLQKDNRIDFRRGSKINMIDKKGNRFQISFQDFTDGKCLTLHKEKTAGKFGTLEITKANILRMLESVEYLDIKECLKSDYVVLRTL